MLLSTRQIVTFSEQSSPFVSQVTKGKKWREISSALNIGSSGSAGFTLRKNYVKYLFNYECTFDRGNMDPAPVLAQLEQMSGKKERKSSASPGK